MSHSTVLVIDADYEAALAPFDENIEVPQYVRETREQIIENKRESIANIRDNGYAEFLKDRFAYIVKYQSNPAHCRYFLDGEFEAKLHFTDEQLYAEGTKFDEPHDLDANGGRLSTYNPKSKWDWYATGGRWDGNITTLDGRKVNQAKLSEIDLDATPPTFAVLVNGEWHERGSMGWFGIVADEKEQSDWEATWRKLIESADPDAVVTLVDVHI